MAIAGVLRDLGLEQRDMDGVGDGFTGAVFSSGGGSNSMELWAAEARQPVRPLPVRRDRM